MAKNNEQRPINRIMVDITAMKVEVESSTESLDKVKLTMDSITNRFSKGKFESVSSDERVRRVGVR